MAALGVPYDKGGDQQRSFATCDPKRADGKGERKAQEIHSSKVFSPGAVAIQDDDGALLQLAVERPEVPPWLPKLKPHAVVPPTLQFGLHDGALHPAPR